jgi:hypothetical protein
VRLNGACIQHIACSDFVDECFLDVYDSLLLRDITRQRKSIYRYSILPERNSAEFSGTRFRGERNILPAELEYTPPERNGIPLQMPRN